MYALQVLWETFWTVLGWFWQIITAFWPYLGIDEWIAKNALTVIIILTLSAGSIYVSKREKRTARNLASIIVDTVSFLKK